MQSSLDVTLASEFLYLGETLQESLCKHLETTLQTELPQALARELPHVFRDTVNQHFHLDSSRRASSKDSRVGVVRLLSDPSQPAATKADFTQSDVRLPGSLSPPPPSHAQRHAARRSLDTQGEAATKADFPQNEVRLSNSVVPPPPSQPHITSRPHVHDLHHGNHGHVSSVKDMDVTDSKPFFRKGFKVKKAYDEMAALVGLETTATHEDDLQPPGNIPAVLEIHEGPPMPPDVIASRSTNKIKSRDPPDTPKTNGSARGWTGNISDGMSSVDLRKGKAFNKGQALRRQSLTASFSDLARRENTLWRNCQFVAVSIMSKARNILNWSWFDTISATAICIYAIFIGVQTEMVAHNHYSEDPTEFLVIEIAFCTLFTFEVLLRITAGPMAFIFSDMWRWNMFDASLVFLQILDILLDLALRGKNNTNTNLSFLRVLRILRLVRVVRVIRVVRMVGELRSILGSILSSLRSLAFTLVLIMFIVFVMGIFLTQLVSNKLKDEPGLGEVLKYFSTLRWSTYILFQSLTGGVDWGNAVEPLLDHISPSIGIFYCLYISFGVLCMLNVVTGVFVESAVNSSAEEKDYAMVNRLQTFLCSSHTTEMTWEEFQQRLDDPEMQLYFKTVDLDISEAEGLFRLLDADGSGTIEAEEFVMGCLRLRGTAKAVDLATLMYENRRMMRHFDRLIHSLALDIEDVGRKVEYSIEYSDESVIEVTQQASEVQT